MILEERECNTGGQASLPPPGVITIVKPLLDDSADFDLERKR